MSNMKTIATAMELYYTDNQAYPIVSQKAVNAVPGLSTYMGNQNPVDPAGAGSYEVTAGRSASGVWTYDIWCPGTHDPSTMKSIEPSTTSTNTTIKYDSVSGMMTASGQGS
jgi:type II secretory pathway pseudopilin PulG